MVKGRQPDTVLFELLNSAAEAMLIVDREGTIVWTNKKTMKLFGYGEEELIDKPVETLVPFALREKHVRHRNDYLRAPRNRPMGAGLDLQALRKDGSEFPVEISLSHARTGAEHLVMATVSDVSARKAQERDLCAREERCRALFEGVLEQDEDGIFLLDPNLEVVWAGNAVEKMFGLTPLKVIGQPFGRLLSAEIAGRLDDGEAFSRRVFESYEENDCLQGIRVRLQGGGRELEYRSRFLSEGYFAGGRVERFVPVVSSFSKRESDRILDEGERERLRQLEREFRTLERLSGPPSTPVTTRLFDLPPLRKSVPDAFRSFLDTYDELLEKAMEMRIYEMEHDLSNPLRELAEKFGALKAGPRDVIEVHRRVMRRKELEDASLKMRGYVEEGTLLLVELLGDLLSFYRNHAFACIGRRDRPEPLGD